MKAGEKEKQCAYHDVNGSEVSVRVFDQSVGGEGFVLSDLPADHEADGAEQLELRPADGADGQEAVEVVHGQAEHLGLRVLVLADLQHPVGDLLAHGGLDLGLDGREVPRVRDVLGFLLEEGSEDAVIAEDDRITVGSLGLRGTGPDH